ncbi:hypothetical protein AOLI_G00289060 [Acnodon oligacanthus]
MGPECGMLSLITLLCISGRLSESVSVSCSPQTVCALRESEVKLTCSYPKTTRTVFWFSFKQKSKWQNMEHPEDLALDSDYAGRVSTESTDSNSALTLRELRESDSGEYHLMIITEQGQNLSSPAVTVTAADLQLKMTQSGQTVTLTCSPSCSLTSKPDNYYWYKNSVYISRYTPYNRPQPLVLSSRADTGSYSCSVDGSSPVKSSAVDVFIEDAEMNVSYTNRQIDAVEGSSVDFLCTYSHPEAERVSKAFWFYFRPEVQSEELSEEEQFAGRVEFIGDKERNCGLRLRDVRERDSGEYRFQFSTQSGETFTGSPGVTLKVTGAEGPEQRSVLKLIAGGVSVFLALILLTAALWMWYCDSAAVHNNHPAMAMTSGPTSRVSDDEDDVHYSSVLFKSSHSQEEPPLDTAKHLDTVKEEVQYAAVNFTAAPRALDAEAADDPSQLYSQIQKHKPPT